MKNLLSGIVHHSYNPVLGAYPDILCITFPSIGGGGGSDGGIGGRNASEHDENYACDGNDDGDGDDSGDDGSVMSRLRVVSYSPGPMLTGMHGKDAEKNGDAHMRSARASPELRRWSRALSESGAFVDEDASAEKCVALLRAGKFENGAQIDWYDDE